MNTNVYSLNKSALFQAFNEVRAEVVRLGHTPEQKQALSERAGRALGQLQNQVLTLDKIREYNTQSLSCECPDCTYRRIICKHIIGKAILDRYIVKLAE